MISMNDIIYERTELLIPLDLYDTIRNLVFVQKKYISMNEAYVELIKKGLESNV